MEQKHGSVSITRYIRTKSNLIDYFMPFSQARSIFRVRCDQVRHAPSFKDSLTLSQRNALVWRFALKSAISPPYRKKALCPSGKTSESFFFFYCLGFHLPWSGNMTRMYKILRGNNLLDYSFLQLLTYLNEIWHALPWKHNVRWIAQCNVTVSLNFSLQSSPETGCLLELYSFIFLYNGGTYLKQ